MQLAEDRPGRDPPEAHIPASRSPATGHALHVVVLAPVGRDAELTRAVLREAGHDCIAAQGTVDLCRRIAGGHADLAVITEEVLLVDPGAVDAIASALSCQPPWSDLPVLLLTRGTGDSGSPVDSAVVLRAVEAFRNILLLERPTRVGTLLSLVRTALRARARQHQLRTYLTQLETTGHALARRTEELARSNEELRDFAYVASHDLKEPLRGIASYAHMLMEDCGKTLDGEHREKLEALVRLPKRMAALLDSLLEFSRLGRIDLSSQQVDLERIAAGAVESLRAWLAERRAEVVIEPGLPSVRCDAALMERVFTNLITNGVKYNLSDPPRVWVGPARPDAALAGGPCAVAVRDNGIGIPQRHYETVFRMFRRLHPRDAFGGGTGAGLSIVKKIVEKHGGQVRLRSLEGQGTTVEFTIPVGPSPALCAQGALSLRATPASAMTRR